MRDHRLRHNGSASPLTHKPPGFAWTAGYGFTPVLPLTGSGYPAASPHRLTTPGSGPMPLTPAPTRRPARAAGWLVSPVPPWARAHGYGNINPLSIDYACRPRLRPRLTLGGRTCPRNPWSFGGKDSHFPCATHACILTPPHSTPVSTDASAQWGTLPYPPHPTQLGTVTRLRRYA